MLKKSREGFGGLMASQNSPAAQFENPSLMSMSANAHNIVKEKSLTDAFNPSVGINNNGANLVNQNMPFNPQAMKEGGGNSLLNGASNSLINQGKGELNSLMPSINSTMKSNFNNGNQGMGIGTDNVNISFNQNQGKGNFGVNPSMNVNGIGMNTNGISMNVNTGFGIQEGNQHKKRGSRRRERSRSPKHSNVQFQGSIQPPFPVPNEKQMHQRQKALQKFNHDAMKFQNQNNKQHNFTNIGNVDMYGASNPIGGNNMPSMNVSLNANPMNANSNLVPNAMPSMNVNMNPMNTNPSMIPNANINMNVSNGMVPNMGVNPNASLNGQINGALQGGGNILNNVNSLSFTPSGARPVINSTEDCCCSVM